MFVETFFLQKAQLHLKCMWKLFLRKGTTPFEMFFFRFVMSATDNLSSWKGSISEAETSDDGEPRLQGPISRNLIHFGQKVFRTNFLPRNLGRIFHPKTADKCDW
jgi:hypothetical protein